jgi:hypothetical protein
MDAQRVADLHRVEDDAINKAIKNGGLWWRLANQVEEDFSVVLGVGIRQTDCATGSFRY